jgi:hypothetical protein
MPDTIDMTEFDDIVRALQEERPEIDPGFARELDKRAAAGFARQRRFRLPSLKNQAAPAVLVGGLAALAITVAVIGGGSDDLSGAGSSSSSASSGDSGGSLAAAPKPTTQEAAPSTAADGGALADRATSSAAAKAGAVAGGRGRLQEQSAALTLVAPGDEVADVGDRILGVADQVGGFVVSSNVRATDGDSDGGGGDFQLRVPVTRLDDALARLSRLAHVSERSQGSQDITAERNVARDRFQEAQAERTALLKQLAEADTTAEIESLKAQLRDVSRAIAAYKASLKQVVRRARYASISVTLQAKPKHAVVGPEDDGKWTPADAIRDAGRFLEVAAGVLLLVGSVLLPLALLGILALAYQRMSAKRGRDRMLDAV